MANKICKHNNTNNPLSINVGCQYYSSLNNGLNILIKRLLIEIIQNFYLNRTMTFVIEQMGHRCYLNPTITSWFWGGQFARVLAIDRYHYHTSLHTSVNLQRMFVLSMLNNVSEQHKLPDVTKTIPARLVPSLIGNDITQLQLATHKLSPDLLPSTYQTTDSCQKAVSWPP